MKKIFLLAATVAFILCSCSQKESQSFPESDAPLATLNLDCFTFSEASTLLKGISKSQSVEVIESGQSRIVTLSPATFKDGNEVYFNGAEADSISFILSPDYVSLSMQNKGRELKFVDYANSEKMAEVVALYNKEYGTVTKSGVSVITRSGNAGLKLNMTELVKSMPEVKDSEPIINTLEAPKYVSKASVAAMNNEVTIRLFKEKGSHTIPHEIGWAKEDLVASVKNLMPNIKLKFITSNCDFEGGRDAVKALTRFYDWRCSFSTSYPSSKPDIFVLMRYGGYKDLIYGRGHVNTYNINNDINDYAVAICSVQPLYHLTMAHEVGHILGANHPSKMYSSSDLMSYSTFKSNKHKDKNNIRRIKENLTVR